MKKLKTIFAVLTVFVFCNASKVNAQGAFEKGKSYASLGYGYSLLNYKNLFFSGVNFTSTLKTSGFGPIGLKYEYAISDKIGIGFSAGYTKSSVTLTDNLSTSGSEQYTYKYSFSKLTITPRLNFHLGGDNKKIDPYIGFGVGFKKVNYGFTTTDSNYKAANISGIIPMSFEASFGCRFLFSENLGGFAEIGAGHGFLQVGLVGKF